MGVIRFCHGEPQPVQVPVASAKAVAIGDIVGVDASGNLKKASEQTFDTNAATTRAAFVAFFMGVSAQLKVADEPVYGNQGSGTIRVDTGGSYRAPIKAGTTAKIGDYVGPTFNATSSLLEDDEVEVVVIGGAIGKITGLPLGATGAEVMIDLFSTKGGVRNLS